MSNRNNRHCRSSGFDSLEDTIGEALAICAEAVSTCVESYARGNAYNHILETVYFTVIFILRSIPELADLARTTAISHIFMVLQTLPSWVNTIVYRCLIVLHDWLRFNEDIVRAKMAFRSLASVCMSVRDSAILIIFVPHASIGMATPHLCLARYHGILTRNMQSWTWKHSPIGIKMRHNWPIIVPLSKS